MRYRKLSTTEFPAVVEKPTRRLRIHSSLPTPKISEYASLRRADVQVTIVERRNFRLPRDLGRFLDETCPWNSQGFRGQEGFGWTPRVSAPGFWINSVFRSPSWNRSYFHWHRNLLTQLFFLRNNGFDDLNIIVQDESPKYQTESLLSLGIDSSRIVQVSQLLGETLEALLSVEGIDQQRGSLPQDLVIPSEIRGLSGRIRNSKKLGRVASNGKKLFVSRGPGSRRDIENEDEVFSYFEKHGFDRINPRELSYGNQVGLFAHATHIVGAHGAALTNILFSSAADVLEFATSGHGFRPDYLQFARATSSKWAMVGFETSSRDANMRVPKEVVDWWLNYRSPEYDFFLSSDFLGDRTA